MRIDKRLFPYPILNNETLYSHYKNSFFGLTYSEEKTKTDYILKDVYCELQNDYLVQLINEGKAQIICIVEAPEALRRKNFVLSLEPTDITIPLSELCGRVVVSAFVVATENIENFRSDDFLDDYDGFSFNIEKYDILAADDGFDNKFNFNDEDDKKKNNIFAIIKDESITDELMKVEYDSNKIVISLPLDQWNIYNSTKSHEQIQNIYFSLIAIPALTQCLSAIQKDAKEEGMDMLELNYKWFDAFKTRYETVNGHALTEDIFQEMDFICEIQRLMEKPVIKAINNIFTLTNCGMGDDYED